MSSFTDTLNDFFGDEIDENEKINLGNEIIVELKELGFDFHSQRQILSGEIIAEVPAALAEKVSKYQSWTIAELPEIDFEARAEAAEREYQRSLAAEEWYQ